jgi:1-acyl-sn-glycerol-3-phosphate acyltransferase
MLKFLPSTLLGVIAISLVTLNTVFWVALFVPVMLFKFIIFHPRVRAGCSRALTLLASRWVDCNSWILKLAAELRWDVELPAALSAQSSYLVLSNHRSWTDIVVLQHVFRDKIPFLKFFLKKVLIWQMLQGKITRIVVRARLLPVPADAAGKDYTADPAFRGRIQAWVNGIWQEKDLLIDSLSRVHGP